MKTTIHRSESRGKADRGWLKARHTFSFADYQDPERMGFGLLRVLNDDIIAPAKGFPTHPHNDMEIISVPLKGRLRHKDSEGNEAVIRHGEVQIMSAGTGVLHSEYNDSDQEEVNLLQIWVLPEKEGVQPRYEQKEFSAQDRKNRFQEVVAPIGVESEGVKINQQAYFSMTDLEASKSLTYKVKKPGNGLYLFVIDGEIKVAGEDLQQRDAIGVEGVAEAKLTAAQNSQVLAIEVPMT